MVTLTAIPVPQLGPNDSSAILVEWTSASNEMVNQGDVICQAETSKSIFEIDAPATGYLTILADVGLEVEVGQPIGVISEAAVSRGEIEAWLAAQQAPAAEAPAERSWTMKAELLAQRHGISIADVPSTGERITEADVQAFVNGRQGAPRQVSSQAHPAPAATGDLIDDAYPARRPQRLLIIGGGDGAVQILDVIAKTVHQRAVEIVDDNTALHGRTLAGVPITGTVDPDRIEADFKRGAFDAAIISISTSIRAREHIFGELRRRGVRFANVIHPSVVIGLNAVLGEGNVVMALSQIGPCASIGNNNFISAYCSVDIGDRVRFGTGIFIEPHIKVGNDAVIGSGSILWQAVPERTVLKVKTNYSQRPLTEDRS
jgi:acetyltransferase-like isoleucine patch superfamily enzyme